jgi:hypothetical protein
VALCGPWGCPCASSEESLRWQENVSAAIMIITNLLIIFYLLMRMFVVSAVVVMMFSWICGVELLLMSGISSVIGMRTSVVMRMGAFSLFVSAGRKDE